MAGTVFQLHGGKKAAGRIKIGDRDGTNWSGVSDAHSCDHTSASFGCTVRPDRGVGIEAVRRDGLLRVCGSVSQLAGAGSRVIVTDVTAGYGRGAEIVNPVDDCPITIGKAVASVVVWIFAASEDIEWRSECRSAGHDKAWRKVMPIRAITVF